MYQYRSHRHEATLDGQTVQFDSDLEERVVRQLLARGFSGRWARREHGITVDGHYYTPDVELAIEVFGRTARAIVEIKPSLAHFHDDKTLTIRMRGIAAHYGTTYFFVYAEAEDAWYQMNPETGVLGPCYNLVPGVQPIAALPTPLAFRRTGRNGRVYVYDPHIIKNVTASLGHGLLEVVRALIQPPKPKRRTRSRRR